MSDSPPHTNTVELSVVMPCLDEAETLAICIHKALEGLAACGVSGEILIADNGSTDGSQAISEKSGARLVPVPEKGYGSALRGGIAAARGRFILIGDADDSYDFRELGRFMGPLREGFDLVMGNRFRGGIRPGAMPPLHRWLGNPVLTAIGRLFFRSPAGDFHCGMRAFSRAAAARMELRTTGMEFASEMVIKATILGLKITEVPVTLSKDGRSRPPHLRSWRDGWRHLRFMLLFSPSWLFLYPGLLLMLAGLLAGLWLLPGPRRFAGVSWDIHTLMYAAAALLIGFQAVAFFVLAKVFIVTTGLHPESPRFSRLFRWFTLETGLLAGTGLSLLGLAMSLAAVSRWNAAAFGALDPSQTLRLVIPGVTTLLLGCQIIFCSLLLSILGLKHR
jgi:glycosyltransferase involved in cell wall biosynthesis